MCDIMTQIENFSAQHNINLRYQWRRRQTAEMVDELFQDWNDRLNNILGSHDENREDNLYKVVDEILKWGGIYKIGKNRKIHYVEKIKKGDCTIDNDTLLSSWTKILAAYDPGKYRIYDSRVAIALRIVVPSYAWFLPPRRNMDVIQYLRRNDNRQEASPQDSYEEYRKILPNEQGERAQCEKDLFMLGGALNIDIINQI